MRGRADASFLLQEVWWLRVMEMRGTSLWKDRFDREIDPFFAEHEGRRTGHRFFCVQLWSGIFWRRENFSISYEALE